VDLNFARQMVLPCAVCAVTFAAALTMAIAGGVAGTRLLSAYVEVGIWAAIVAFIAWMLIPLAARARRCASSDRSRPPP
jgi:hypothetical protein